MFGAKDICITEESMIDELYDIQSDLFYYIIDPPANYCISDNLVDFLKPFKDVHGFIDIGSRVLIIPKTCTKKQISQIISNITYS
jgi:hypothetical protein